MSRNPQGQNYYQHALQSNYQETSTRPVYGIHVANEIRGILRNNYTPYYPPNGHSGTFLMTLPIEDISAAGEIFGSTHPSPCQPLVLEPSPKPLRLFTIIPHGVSAIVTKFGKCSGVYPSGLAVTPLGTRVQYIVSQQYVPFDYPIKLCPTLDNVMVKIDTMIVFRISDPIKFLVELGPYKLNDMLAAFLEESIRSLARTTTYDDVYSLRGVNLESMVRSLNDKVTPYGVEVHQITITNIQLPIELQNSMQRTTQFNALDRCRQKSHAYDVALAMNKENREMTKSKRNNDMAALEEEQKKSLFMLNKEVLEIEALTTKRLAELTSETEAEVRRITLEAQKEEATLKGEKYKVLLLLKTKGELDAALISAQTDVYVADRVSKAKLASSENYAKSITLIADAESKCSKHLKQKRAYDLNMKKLDVLNALARNPNVVISGSNDYDQMAQIGGYKGLALPLESSH